MTAFNDLHAYAGMPAPLSHDELLQKSLNKIAVEAASLSPKVGFALERTAYEFHNLETGHAIVDYSEHTYVGHLSREKGYTPIPLYKIVNNDSASCSDAKPAGFTSHDMADQGAAQFRAGVAAKFKEIESTLLSVFSILGGIHNHPSMPKEVIEAVKEDVWAIIQRGPNAKE